MVCLVWTSTSVTSVATEYCVLVTAVSDPLLPLMGVLPARLDSRDEGSSLLPARLGGMETPSPRPRALGASLVPCSVLCSLLCDS